MVDLNNCNIVSLFFIYLYVSSVIGQEIFYDRRYDYYDIDTLIQNPRLLKRYLDCFLERGPCTPIGRVFRRLLPDAVTTACKRCSPSQRRLARKTFNAFKAYFPDSHAALISKLDPNNKYYEAFEEAITNA